ncbi:OmpH family outer membrane protein [Halomonas ramblicola]|uniref:OmpH family outer membrane protein n=1 Tax=Halomonas ramblicola TaxID=747349 RepID=UPI0025B489FC|nr:OmpH family outer membrane protein [Halomonas ramblicola]MDN3521355.1 OmpH family outer membrane protein [Halomonas ramblicola]
MPRLTAVLALLLTTLALPALADDVATLDWRRALMETDAAQSSMSELENRIGSQQQQAQSLGQELQQMQQRLQQEGEGMSESERQAAIQEFQQKGAEFERLRGEIMQAQQQSEQQFLERAEPRLEQAVDQVVARHSIQVLVDPQGVLHAEGELQDVTEEVTEILNTLL